MNVVGIDIPLAVVGCDFRMASSSLRSRLVAEDREVIQLTAGLRQAGAADGLVELTTCNRNEWIVSSDRPKWATTLLSSRMVERIGNGAGKGFSPYVYIGEEGARHIFRVALGQESLVVGERQISGQIQKALGRARRLGTGARILNGLGTAVGRMVRKAIQSGGLLQASMGVHSLAVAFLASRKEMQISRVRVAIVGMGQIGRRVLSTLGRDSRYEVIGVNRTIEAWKQNQHVVPIRELANVLDQVDAAIFCTSAPSPVVRSREIKMRSPERPLLLIDLGIPQQVDRADKTENIWTVGLDELIEFHRQKGAEKPENTRIDLGIEKAIQELRCFCNQQGMTEILSAIEQNYDRAVQMSIPEVLDRHRGSIPQPLRDLLASELQSAILEHSNELLQQIRKAVSAKALRDR